jgi:DNA invertase Pin-like site-specific DNA recombinase
MPNTINIRVDSLKGTYYDEKGISDFKKVIELKKEKITQTETAERLNLHVAQVNRMLKKGYKPYQTNAKYWSDYKRKKDWFYGI